MDTPPALLPDPFATQRDYVARAITNAARPAAPPRAIGAVETAMEKWTLPAPTRASIQSEINCLHRELDATQHAITTLERERDALPA